MTRTQFTPRLFFDGSGGDWGRGEPTLIERLDDALAIVEGGVPGNPEARVFIGVAIRDAMLALGASDKSGPHEAFASSIRRGERFRRNVFIVTFLLVCVLVAIGMLLDGR